MFGRLRMGDDQDWVEVDVPVGFGWLDPTGGQGGGSTSTGTTAPGTTTITTMAPGSGPGNGAGGPGGTRP